MSGVGGLSADYIKNENQEKQAGNFGRIQTPVKFRGPVGRSSRIFARFTTAAKPLVIGKGLIWIETNFLSICANEPAIEDASRQQMEFFLFDGEKEPATDAGFGCNLIEGDPFGFPGSLETRTKVGHFGLQQATSSLRLPRIIWIRCH